VQHDKKTWIGGSHEIKQYEEETGKHSFWTNSMFGGMPSYLVSNYAPSNVSKYLYKAVSFNNKMRPASFIFMLAVGFFIALLLFGVDVRLSIAGAFAFAFSSYFLIIIEAGHITKVVALAFMPPIVAGIYHAYRKNMIAGTLVVTVFTALQLLVNHLQITYYTLLIVLVYLVFEIIYTVKNKRYVKFLKTSGLLLAGALIAVSTNFSQIITTYDYGKDSIRGKSELSDNKHNKTSGLDKDYATAWSYGKLETLNMLIPDLAGGASSGELSEDSETYKVLKRMGVPNADALIKQMPLYWGPQPFTSGPVYVGAFVVFLFILGMFTVKDKAKYWLFAATILSVLLAWGKNFNFLTDFFLDYFPMYNKFRTVSMILVIAEFTIPLLAVLALKEIAEGKTDKKEFLKALKYTSIITGGIFLILMIPGVLSFKSDSDAQMFGNWPAELVEAIQKDRASLFYSDLFRSVAFILAGVAAISAFVYKKISLNLFYIIIGLIFLLDLAGVDKRYLNADDFVSARKEKAPFTESTADKFILKDKDPDFRVLNLSVSTFNDASTSYFHKSVGGYHGAKLRRYQDLIDNILQYEIAYLIQVLQQKDISGQDVNAVLFHSPGLNMLNTKYIIFNPDLIPLINNYRLGNAWFVSYIKPVKNADEEIKSIRNFNPELTAVVDERFKDNFFKFRLDSSATIKLTEYKPDYLAYKSNANSDQLAVFSEIYYAKGWQAYIDGKPVPHFRADYVLRAMRVPAGSHKIEFKFEPAIWKIGNTVSLAGSVIFILFISGGLFLYYKNAKNKNENDMK